MKVRGEYGFRSVETALPVRALHPDRIASEEFRGPKFGRGLKASPD